MSTNEQLVLRAEQAAQQTAQNKAEIEAMVTKLEQVQAPAIASAKEDIKQALIEKGQTVDDNVPFSEYGNKVRAIEIGNLEDSSGTGGPQVLVSNDSRWRWFDIDSQDLISSVQSTTYCSNMLAINGNAFRVFGPVDYDNELYRCIPLTDRSDISHVYYREDNKYLFLTKSGELYGIDEVWDKTIPLDLKLITTGVDSVCPSNDNRYWVKKGNVVEYWNNYEYKGNTDSISHFISNKADGGSYNMGYTFMAVKTNGELITVQNVSESDTDIYVQVLSPASPTGSWKDVCFHGYDEYSGGGCYGLATDTEGNLYYASIRGYELAMLSSLSFTKIEGISGVKTKPGYCITSMDFSWDDETGEELYIPRIDTVALVIDGQGRLWRLSAAVENNGSSLSGISKEQVGEDTDWVWCEPQINRNGVSMAQKGNKLLRIHASDTNELTFTIDKVRSVTGTVENIYSPSSGDWCIITK